MAFESNLPVGTVPFSTQLYKDGNGRIWTGNEFSSEYYRLFDPSDMPYINIKDFGAMGDGVTDDTDAWDEALSLAIAHEMALYIPTGKYPVTVSVDQIIMNGCAGIAGDGELVFTSTGNPDRPLLLWAGTKSPIAAAIPVSVGQTSFTVDTGLSIAKGDTIFVASNDNVYTDLDTSSGNYKKGGRFTVDTYDNVTGVLVCFEPSYYAITSAYLYHNADRPKVSLKDVSISIAGNQDKKGIEIRLGELLVDAVKVNGFGRFGINSSSSLCRVNRSLLYAEAIAGTTTGYCLQCSGLSDVIFSDSIFYGNRHGVACGDSGYWRTTDVGETVEAVIALPPIVRGSGSRIEGSSYALDSHAGTTLLDVYNCDIYGGVIGGALETYATGCRIHQGEAAMAVRMGRDRQLNTRDFHNKYKFTNCEVYATTQAFGIYADLERVDLLGVNVYVPASGAARMMIDYNSGSIVRNWNIRGIKHYGNAGDSCNYFFRMMNGSAISDCELQNARISMEFRNVTGRQITHMKVVNSTIKVDSGNALEFDYFDLNKGIDFTVSECTIYGGAYGIIARGTKSITVANSNIAGQATTLHLRSSSGAAVPLIMNGNVLTNAGGVVVNVQTGQSMPTVLIGNVFRDSAFIGASVTVTGKYGNIGLDDKLKTELTGSTTTKYGSISGSGDLTLS